MKTHVPLSSLITSLYCFNVHSAKLGTLDGMRPASHDERAVNLVKSALDVELDES